MPIDAGLGPEPIPRIPSDKGLAIRQWIISVLVAVFALASTLRFKAETMPIDAGLGPNLYPEFFRQKLYDGKWWIISRGCGYFDGILLSAMQPCPSSGSLDLNQYRVFFRQSGDCSSSGSSVLWLGYCACIDITASATQTSCPRVLDPNQHPAFLPTKVFHDLQRDHQGLVVVVTCA
jgi:hypothetical protein